jgi:peptidoglycan/xylan/chitin deacetylase (PgdA/CDA1 family)
MLKIYHCFPAGRHKVLTLSYDDGKLQDRRLVALFNQYGLKSTFHLNSGLMDQPERIPSHEIKALYQGHEVAAHTLTHLTISRCPLDQIAQQILEDRKNLETLVGYPVRGLSYPNGSYNQTIKDLLPQLGIEYSRIVGGTNQFTMPEDLLAWQATCHHRDSLMDRAREFLTLVKTQYFYMMYVWGHSSDFDQDRNWDVIETFCQFISGRDDIWYATNIEIVDYLKALQNLKFAASGQFVYNPSAQSVWLSVNDQTIEVKGGARTKLE